MENSGKSKKLSIAIIGSRGIPNAYGGFEQFAEYLSVGLVEAGHSVSVYNSSQHPYKENSYKNVRLIHCYDPEHKLGTAGQFIYDLNCIWHSRKQNFDVVLFLGYTSSSIWFWLFPKQPKRFTNMDGLEWKRTKYSKPIKRFLEFAEWLGAKFGGHLVADSEGIKNYLKNKYDLSSTFIPYGAETFDNPDERILAKYDLEPYSYNMLIARLEPENNIETILHSVSECNLPQKMIVVGNTTNDFGNQMKERYESEHIVFTEGIYNTEDLNNLRYFSNLYFHGHTVGGTNPSLLEAMACKALIVAHDNEFNKAILGADSFYFNKSEDLSNLLNNGLDKNNHHEMVKSNYIKIRDKYTWGSIIDRYNAIMTK